MDQRALLLTVGSPTSSNYLVAQQFEMRRVSDGAVFTWVDMGQRGKAPVDPANAALHNGNYALPDSAAGTSLGAFDIQPNEAYELEILVDGQTIQGLVSVPASFALTIQ